MSEHHDNHGVTTGKYMAGFVLAVILTLFSFIPVMYNMLDGWTISGKILYLLGFALLQIVVQIVYFLHLNHGPDASWNIGTLLFAAVGVFIVIGGTWWAIQHLNYNMMGGSGRIIIPAPIEATQSKAKSSGQNLLKPAPIFHDESSLPNEAIKGSPSADESYSDIESYSMPE